MDRENLREGIARPENGALQTPERIHYMDNLRALAMLCGVLFHAALAYSAQGHEFWITAMPEKSVLLDAGAWFLHLFRMPLFFLISGYFSYLLLNRWGPGKFAAKRSLRVLLPFLVFLPLLMFAFIQAITFGFKQGGEFSPMMLFIASVSGNPDAEPPPMTTMHLWFLLNLCWFYVILMLLNAFKVFESNLINRLCTPNTLIVLLPILIFPSFLYLTTPHPAPEKFTPQLWSFGLFGLFFLAGVLIAKTPSLLDAIAVKANLLLGISLVSYALYYYLMPEPVTLAQGLAAMGQGAELSFIEVVRSVLESIIAVYMTLACLHYARKWLGGKSKTMRLFSDASYWIYLIHVPLLFFVQFYFARFGLTAELGWLVDCVVTIAIGMLSYLLLVRFTPVGWMLNGRRKKAGHGVDQTAKSVTTNA